LKLNVFSLANSLYDAQASESNLVARRDKKLTASNLPVLGDCDETLTRT
jgi:hypothetical protein